LQKSREVCLTSPAPNLRDNNGTGAQGPALALSFPQSGHHQAVIVFNSDECPGI
jgi:hypothetical protein